MADIFSDGFEPTETNNFENWTSKTVDTGNTLEIATAYFKEGAKSLHSIVVNGADYAVVEKTIAAQTDVYARCYALFKSFANPTGEDPFTRFMKLCNGGGDSIACAAIVNDSGSPKFGLHYREGNHVLHIDHVESPLPTVDTWFCVEIHGIYSATVGEAHLWINGNEVITVTGMNNTAMGQMDDVLFGQHKTSGAATGEFYLDSLRVNNSYIGPLSSQIQDVVTAVINQQIGTG